MSYAYVEHETIMYESDELPMNSQVRQDNGEVITTSLKFLPEGVRIACGWYEVVDIPKPPDTDFNTYVRTLQFDMGVVQVMWVYREWTTEELWQRTLQHRRENAESLIRGAVSRLNNLRTLAANRTDASNLTQVNTQLQAIADGISDISTVMINVLRFDVLPDLLEDADELD